MKKRFFVFLTALLMLFSVLPVFAEEMTAEQRVFDDAELLSEADEREMHLWIKDMQENWGMDLAYLTTNDTEGKSVQEYGADFYVEHDLGLGENYDGVIFVLDMGEPVKIADLAKNMITLAGLELGKDIKIEYVGLRPGEKLYEELLSNEENTIPTVHKKIFLAKVRRYNYENVKANFEKLKEVTVTMDKEATVAQMKEIVPEFKSCNSRYGRLDK